MRPHRRRWRDAIDVGIESAQWVGLTAFGAVGVEQKIVKVPKYEVFVTLAGPTAIAAVDSEEDFAIDQQAEQFQTGKARLPPQPADLLRRGQRGNHAGNSCIANLERRAGTRRFQNHLIAAPSQVGEPRQHDRIGSAKLRGLRPIIG